MFSKSSTNAINIITIIATVGVIVSSAILFIVLSGFSGLRTFSYSLLDASDPDLKISPVKGKKFELTTEISQLLLDKKNIKLYAPVVEERVFLQHHDKNAIAKIKGVSYDYNAIIAIDSVLHVGTWLDKDFPATAVIGNGISYKLSLGVLNFSDALQVKVPKPGNGFLNPNNAFNAIKVQVVGVYGGTEEFQNKYIFTNINLAQHLLGYKQDEVSAIEIKLNNVGFSEDVRDQLQQELGDEFKVETKEQLNSMFYKVINTENFIGYLIGTLITIIALFNILGSIIMMIVDKKDNLKTLYKLGTTLKEIKRIFVLQGFLLTIIGMLIGLRIAVELVLIQQYFGVFMITEHIAYPVEFRWINLFIVIGTIAVLGFLASLIASSRITSNFLTKNS